LGTDRSYSGVRCTVSAVARVLQVGERVEVHTRYNDAWVGGFEIAEVVEGGYRVRRTSDGSLLPNLTGEADLRPALD
jgi:hypothetical protein